MGFEPMTYHLRGGCSATELLRRTRQDTNAQVAAGIGAGITVGSPVLTIGCEGPEAP
jgi:hypothetical protein